MGDLVNQILAHPIQLADRVIKAADEASSLKSDCFDLKLKTENLAALLRQAARAGGDLYERPTRRIIDETNQVLERALTLVYKCRANGLIKRVFNIIPAAAFRKTSSQLESSAGDLSWLLSISAAAAPDGSDDGGDFLVGLPPVAANEPILCLIWQQIRILSTGSLSDRSDAAGSLVSLANDNIRYGKLIIEEGGVGPLLKLVKEGNPEGQESAAKALGLLGKDVESVEHMIQAGVCLVFAKILKEGPMKVQAVVAWAVSELVANHPQCQDLFAQHNTIRLLVSHLAFETIQEHSNYAIANKSIHAIVVASSSNRNKNTEQLGLNVTGGDGDPQSSSKIPYPLSNQPPSKMQNVVANTMAMTNESKSRLSNGVDQTNHAMAENIAKQNHHHHHQGNLMIYGKGREHEEPSTKDYMKAMAARALSCLASGNSAICKSITESRALLCFAVLLERGPEEVQHNSVMALKEITAVAEKDPDLRRSAFKPSSPACKAVVDQFVTIIKKGDSELLIPCVESIGNLARTFRATETRVISPLVQLLDQREAEVSREACLSLQKFACPENYLHHDHSKAIIAAGGAMHLVQLAYFGEHIVQTPAMVLLCYVAMHVPDSAELAAANVLNVLEWASKQTHLFQDEVAEWLQEAKSRLELYQSRGSRAFS